MWEDSTQGTAERHQPTRNRKITPISEWWPVRTYPLLWRVLLPRIISAAGADHEFAVSLGVGFHVDGAVAPYAFRGRWLVTDCVLVSDVVSDAAADLVHFIQRAW